MAEERPLSSSLPAFPAQPGSEELHRFARFVVACTVVLVLAGSLVTSTGSGLAVPDWPTSYGWSMFTFPPAMWVGGIFYEHGHRLIASGVGFLTIVLAIWLWLADPRRWMKRLGAIALATVILQGVLGGLTVLFFLPDVHLHCTRGSRRALLLHHGRDRRFQLPGLAQRHRASGRRSAPACRSGHDDRDLRPDSGGRDDEAFGRRPRDPRFSADVRRGHPRPLGLQDRGALCAPGWSTRCHAGDHGNGGTRVVASPAAP